MIFRSINVTQLYVHLDFIEQGQQSYGYVLNDFRLSDDSFIFIEITFKIQAKTYYYRIQETSTIMETVDMVALDKLVDIMVPTMVMGTVTIIPDMDIVMTIMLMSGEWVV